VSDLQAELESLRTENARLRKLLKLTDAEAARLFEATRDVLRTWTARLQQETGDAFPEKVTAFRPGMAVHGRYKQPCPRCGAPVQRIAYARNEANYCAPCQTGSCGAMLDCTKRPPGST